MKNLSDVVNDSEDCSGVISSTPVTELLISARYSDMHCSNSSQTSLQRFDDAVVTFIRQEKCLLKVITVPDECDHSIIEMLQ